MKLNILSILILSCFVSLLTNAASLVTTLPTNVLSVSANGNSFAPMLSSDGRRVLFMSHAPNLRTNEVRHDTLQLFAHDLFTGNTTLVSATTNGEPANADFTKFNISSNGQFVVFTSDANHLVAADVNNTPDIFVRDVTSNITRIVTLNRSGFIIQQGFSSTNQSVPLISANGRYVFFESRATDLTQEAEMDFNNAEDIYRRDMQSNITKLVTREYQFPQNAPSAGSSLVDITPDGRKVVFISAAWGIVPGGFSGTSEVYVRDMVSGNTVQASSPILNIPFGSQSYTQAKISEDGRFVAFMVKLANSWPVESILYLRDLQTNAAVALATNLSSPIQFSADGRYILFEQETNIFRLDVTTQTNELVNITLNGLPTNGIARDGVMTPDGNGVLFNSDIVNLTTNTVSGYHLYARNMAAETTRLIILATNGQPSAAHKLPALFSATPDLARVAFDSLATELVSGDENCASDVFLRDMTNETTTLISKRLSGVPAESGRGHAFINGDCLSADGRFLVFSGYDNELLPNDTNGRPDVFIRDLTTGALTTPGFSTNAARSPVISADGRYVVYLRRQPSYPFETAGGAFYRFDRQTGTNELVSPTSTSVRPAISSNGNWVAFLSNAVLVARDMSAGTSFVIGNAASASGRDAAFTPDGKYILFSSTAALTLNATAGRRNLFAWHTTQHAFTLLSWYDGMDVGSSGAFAISQNSRFVAFSGLNNFELYRHDFEGTNRFLRFNAHRPGINADGTLVSCVELGFQGRLLLFDVNTNEEFPILTNITTSSTPLFSPDGRWLIYSRRVVIPLDDFNGRYTFQLFVWDRMARTNCLISRSLAGTNANASASTASFAADSRTVVFHSAASDLTAGDYNDKLDVFVLKLGGGDVDDDGLDDDWEVTYFSNLSHDGNGDSDNDGASDRIEFLSLTDPTNNGSVFRVITLAPVGGGARQLFWQGNPVRRYQVEYKEDLAATNWNTLYSSIAWNGSTASTTDFPAESSTNRYYRVVLLP